MKIKSLLALGLSILIMSATAQAQDEVKMEKADWAAQVAAQQQQQAAQQRTIDSLNKAINGTKDEGTKVDQETEQVWQEIYAALGTDKAGVEAYKKQITDLEAKVAEQAKLSDEALSKPEKQKELEALKAEVAALKKDKRYALTETYNKVNDLNSRVDQLISRGKNYTPPKPRHDSYSVVMGDYLWRISGKKEVYSDPFQWVKIYSANREQIKNPDLIYANQTFVIPRSEEANEYWVQRGDNLKSIAQSRLGNPSDWWKIYNANKNVIDNINKGADTKVIYPHTILIIPKN